MGATGYILAVTTVIRVLVAHTLVVVVAMVVAPTALIIPALLPIVQLVVVLEDMRVLGVMVMVMAPGLLVVVVEAVVVVAHINLAAESGYLDKVVAVQAEQTRMVAPEATGQVDFMAELAEVSLIKVKVLSVLFGPVTLDCFRQLAQEICNEPIH
jgi:hypothetical protein